VGSKNRRGIALADLILKNKRLLLERNHQIFWMQTMKQNIFFDVPDFSRFYILIENF